MDMVYKTMNFRISIPLVTCFLLGACQNNGGDIEGSAGTTAESGTTGDAGTTSASETQGTQTVTATATVTDSESGTGGMSGGSSTVGGSSEASSGDVSTNAESSSSAVESDSASGDSGGDTSTESSTAGATTGGDTTGGDTTSGDTTSGTGGSTGTATNDGTATGGSTGFGGNTPNCGGDILACNDGTDNDMDGLVDLADPECVSPCDDDESTFATGLPGDNKDCKQDCFFDGNSGSGNDGCVWDLKCDPEQPSDDCKFNGGGGNCDPTPTQECKDNCEQYTPSGCDCFGCCKVVVDGTTYTVFLGDEECSIDTIATCNTCTFNGECGNDCDPAMCELCLGQDPSDLPEECNETPTCPGGEQVCTSNPDGTDNCPTDYFCQVGCCKLIPPG